MSQWGSCLARLRECVRRLILDEVDEESMGLFESDDKVCLLCLAGNGHDGRRRNVCGSTTHKQRLPFILVWHV